MPAGRDHPRGDARRGGSDRRGRFSKPASGSSRCRSTRPSRLESIGRHRRQRSATRALIGAGTVLDPADVPKVAAGRRQADRLAQHERRGDRGNGRGRPGLLARLFHAVAKRSWRSRPERTALKLFPAEAASPAVLKAQRAVLPKGVPIIVVGGVTPESIARLARGRRGRLRARRRPLQAGPVDRGDHARKGARLRRGGETLMRPIRIAIIGFGKIAADQHVPSIAGNPRFELAATSSRSGKGVDPVFTDWRELIAKRRGARSGRDHDPAIGALRNRPRVHRARACTACSKSRRPPP